MCTTHASYLFSLTLSGISISTTRLQFQNNTWTGILAAPHHSVDCLTNPPIISTIPSTLWHLSTCFQSCKWTAPEVSTTNIPSACHTTTGKCAMAIRKTTTTQALCKHYQAIAVTYHPTKHFMAADKHTSKKQTRAGHRGRERGGRGEKKGREKGGRGERGSGEEAERKEERKGEEWLKPSIFINVMKLSKENIP